MEVNQIAYISDEDFDAEPVPMNNPFKRVGARGIVIREDGKVALFHEKNKGDYKLPGGGVEGGERPALTFKREVYEEIGCEIDNIQEIGITLEERSLTNFVQISHVFIAKLKKDLKELHLTAKERVWGGEVLWVTPKEAIGLVSDCIDKLHDLSEENEYHLKFMVLRDKRILEYVFGGEAFSGEMVM